MVCCLGSLQTEIGLLVVDQHYRHKFSRNASHVHIFYQNWTVPNDSPTFSQTSWIVHLQSTRIASQNFVMFASVVLVDGRPERSSSTDIHPALNCLQGEKVLHWFMTLSLNASWSIWTVSTAFFFKVWNKIWCRFLFFLNICHTSCSETYWIAKTNLTKLHRT